jgi:ATP-dependent Lon protease
MKRDLDVAPEGAARRSERLPSAEASSAGAAETLLPENGTQLLMPLRNLVIFPGMVQTLAVGRSKSLALVQQAALSSDKLFAVAAQKDTEQEDPPFESIYHVGCLVRILKLIKMPDGTQTTVVQGVSRIGLTELVHSEPYFAVRCEVLRDVVEPGKGLDALVVSSQQLVGRLTELSSQVPDEASIVANNLQNPGQIADFIVANLNYDADRKQMFLEELNVRRRLEKATELLSREIEVLELAGKIQANVKTSLDKSQREYFLREQLRAIQEELGVEDERSRVLGDLRKRLDGAGLPEEVRKEADRELQRLEVTPVQAPDFNVSRTYLEYLADLPWRPSERPAAEIEVAERVLDEDHYGLAKVKKRIVEFLAVNKLRRDIKGPILCLAGPPGVGKTSLGRSVARATGRRFVRVSLGGVRDEAEIRGHRRTYVGALPGRILQEIRKAGTNDPVFMLDEVDKLGADVRGDPTAALLEVLDPEQNHSFTDHYLDVPYDLSRVMFIATANMLETIPSPLKDRMEIISLPGYTETEKLQIAKRYLVPRTLASHGLKGSQLRLSDSALREIVRHYTREAGVRNLERQVAAICRAVARRMVSGSRAVAAVRIAARDVAEYLGPQQFVPDIAARTSVPGVVTGLGWTPTGGDILFVEATDMRGSGNLTLTGQLGSVMRESAQTALSYVRSRVVELGIAPERLSNLDLHIHVPAGAIPKDGPSAGIAVFAALVSLLTGRPAAPNVAMTGEITLRGLVLPVGGVKEKVLGAARAGIRKVILPERNAVDLDEVPQEIREKMTFVVVRRMEEVLPAALRGWGGRAGTDAGAGRKGGAASRKRASARAAKRRGAGGK